MSGPPATLPPPQSLSTALTDSSDSIVAAVHTNGLRCPLCGMHSTVAAALCAHVLACHRGARVGFELAHDSPDSITMRLMPGGSSMLHGDEPRPRDRSQNCGVWVRILPPSHDPTVQMVTPHDFTDKT